MKNNKIQVSISICEPFAKITNLYFSFYNFSKKSVLFAE